MNFISIFTLLFFSTACFAQIESASPATVTPTATPAVTPANANDSKIHDHQNPLAALTPAERQEFLMARQKALMDPAVQSTREITRMALHKAMLRVDPSVETIFANMNAHGPEKGEGISRHQKNMGDHFDRWLSNNFPSTSVAALTPEEKEQLRQAHDKALFDPSVRQARKDAHLVFYNALTNADPLIKPLLAKIGFATPSNVRSLSKNSLGSEEQILGGNFQAWGEEVLAPAIKNESTPASSAQ